MGNSAVRVWHLINLHESVPTNGCRIPSHLKDRVGRVAWRRERSPCLKSTASNPCLNYVLSTAFLTCVSVIICEFSLCTYLPLFMSSSMVIHWITFLILSVIEIDMIDVTSVMKIIMVQ